MVLRRRWHLAADLEAARRCTLRCAQEQQLLMEGAAVGHLHTQASAVIALL
jgi:hypothetical protein